MAVHVRMLLKCSVWRMCLHGLHVCMLLKCIVWRMCLHNYMAVCC